MLYDAEWIRGIKEKGGGEAKEREGGRRGGEETEKERKDGGGGMLAMVFTKVEIEHVGLVNIRKRFENFQKLHKQMGDGILRAVTLLPTFKDTAAVVFSCGMPFPSLLSLSFPPSFLLPLFLSPPPPLAPLLNRVIGDDSQSKATYNTLLSYSPLINLDEYLR